MKLDTLIWAENWKKGLISVAGILLLIYLIQYFADFSSYLFYLRVPLLFGLLVVSFPILSVTVLSSMFRNLFVQAHWQQICLIVLSAMVTSTAVILTFDSILQNAADRFFAVSSSLTTVAQETARLPFLLKVSLAIGLSMSNIWVLHKYSKDCEKAIQGIAAGTSCGILLIALIIYVSEWPAFSDLRSFFFIVETNQAGYFYNKTLLSSHIILASFTLISLFIYCWFGGFFKPWHRNGTIQIPALVYLNIIATFSCLLFAGLTFYFDAFHFPVFLGFLLVSACSYHYFKVDHYYEITPLNEPKPPVSTDFSQIINKRLAHQHGEKTMVVVCCSGGGIQASAWTAQVLTGLQKEQLLGDSFSKAITLISSVSGGSVGSLFYLDHYNQQGVLPLNDQPMEQDEIAQAVFNGATTDVLNSVGWGLAYPDLLRFVGLPWLPPKMMDRATVVEENWKINLSGTQPTFFSDWRNRITEGLLPIPLFNATLVESGKRFIISPLSFNHGDNRQCEDFSSSYVGMDVDAVSAARLSATFPYVSPISRNTPQPGYPDYHVADGGFFDNYGVFSSLEWIKNHLLPQKKSNALNLKNILLLEIHAFSEEDTPPPKNVSGWKTALLGPVSVLLNARGSTQIARNNMEVEIMKEKLKKDGLNLQQVVISFPTDMPSPYPEEMNYTPPLSWKLSGEEKQVVKQAWKHIQALPAEENPIKTIQQLWKQWSA